MDLRKKLALIEFLVTALASTSTNIPGIEVKLSPFLGPVLISQITPII